MTPLETLIFEDAKQLVRDTLNAAGWPSHPQTETDFADIALGVFRSASPEQRAALDATPVETVRAGFLASMKRHLSSGATGASR